MLEHSKTNQYNIFTKINQLEQKLTPVVTFITNLQKELEEEDDA
jgi:regulator of replication initiation timing